MDLSLRCARMRNDLRPIPAAPSMHTIIHRFVVLFILIAGVLLARLYPALDSSQGKKLNSESAPQLAPVIANGANKEPLSVRTPVTPVASPESLGMFYELPTDSLPIGDTMTKSSDRTKRPKERPRSKPRQTKPRTVPRIAQDEQGNGRSHDSQRRPERVRKLPSVRQERMRKRRRGRLTTHRIADGDDLRLLAGKYLRNESRHMEIFELNRQILSRPDLLPIGKEIQVYDERD